MRTLKRLLLATSLVAGLSGVTSAKAQTTIIIDLDSSLCALLPYELQGVCYDDVSPTGQGRAEAVRFCSNMGTSYFRNECYDAVKTGHFSRAALQICGRHSNDYMAIECLRQVKNGYYQAEAAQVCMMNQNAYFMNECLGTIRGKYYQMYELQACERETNAYNQNQCLRRFGSTLNHGGGSFPRPYPPQRPLPQEPPRPLPGADMCEVHNSSSYITTIPARRFQTYAKDFAISERSCVVSNVLNEQRSRTLYGPRGRVLGQNLTEREVDSLKSQYGLTRCRILTCR